MLRKTLLIFATLSLLAACNSKTEEQSGENALSSTEIHLNDGEKWQVNAEMKPHLNGGKELLENYMANGGSDYIELAKQLITHNRELIQSRTMKGEAHDELHKWLYPHMKMIARLKKAGDAEAAAPIITELRDSYRSYDRFFE